MLLAILFIAIGQTGASFIPAIFPKPTITSDNDLGVYGWTPKPTNALLQLPGELKKRATADTCGYISGDGLQPLTCAAGYQCIINTILKAAACCVDTGCTLFTACLPKASTVAGVTYNSRVGLCTQGSFTQCQTKAYNYGAAGYLSEYDCGVSSTYIVVSTTSTFTTPPVVAPLSTPVTTTVKVIQSGSTVTSVATSVVTTVSSAAPVTTISDSAPTVHQQTLVITATQSGATTAAPPLGAGTAGASTGTVIAVPVNPIAGSATTGSTSTATTTSSPSKPFPIGAAVGGAVGGLAVIGAAIAGIIFLVLRSKRKDKNNPTRGVDNMAEYMGPTGAAPIGQQTNYAPPPAAYIPPQGYPQPPPQIYQQQGPPQNYPQNQAELAAFAQNQNDPNKGFNQPDTRSFSPPLSPAPPYPPSQYNSSPPLGNAAEMDGGRPVRRSELY